jgi:hypothetical protein
MRFASVFAIFGLFARSIYGSDLIPRSPKINVARGLLQGGAVLAGGLIAGISIPNPIALALSKYPIRGSEDIMSPKSHGTSNAAVQSKLRWKCDRSLADRICNYNRRWAEHAGYWTQETSFLSEADPTTETTFYDSVTG